MDRGRLGKATDDADQEHHATWSFGQEGIFFSESQLIVKYES